MQNLLNEKARRQDAFHEGDSVVLAEVTYQGTSGVFVRLRGDRNWADIKERNGIVREHPVAWLAHAVSAIRLAGAIAGHPTACVGGTLCHGRNHIRSQRLGHARDGDAIDFLFRRPMLRRLIRHKNVRLHRRPLPVQPATAGYSSRTARTIVELAG
jgi:hypothetical protein